MEDDVPRDEPTANERLPQTLIDELRRREEGMPTVTARVDREIAELASAHFAKRGIRRRVGPVPLAAAASLLIAAIVLSPFAFRPDTDPAMLGDVDGSGRVDIADVLAAARSGDASRAELDAYARQVVSLANWEDAT